MGIVNKRCFHGNSHAAKKRIDISQLCPTHHIIKTDQDKLDISHDYIPSSVSVVVILCVCRTELCLN